MFKKTRDADAVNEFTYLPASEVYFDSACQSLRPQSVIDAMQEYYHDFNSCGERVKYQWGLKVDEKVESVRGKILEMLKLSSRDYFVCFTLNTTYGLNLTLSQLRPDGIDKIITSDIEHNSSFLSTMAFSKRTGIARQVLTRNDDGSIDLDNADFTNAVVVMNAVSNIDGRRMSNIKEVSKKIHKQGGIFIVDAAQTMAFYHDMLMGVEPDVICFSGHKMYGPSMGVIVMRRKLLDRMDISFIGGGMVDDVTKDDYKLSAENAEHIHTAFEAGLQPYAEIIGLGAAIDYIERASRDGHKRVIDYSQQIIDFMNQTPGFHFLNREAGPTIAFYHEGVDSHLLAEAMSDEGIMARSGYFCVHYYLDHVKHYPPLIRLSLGMHNRQSDVDKFINAMEGISK